MQDDDIWASLETALRRDDGTAAEDHLAHGYPIYCQAEGVTNAVEKRYPDGRRELVRFDLAGEHVLTRTRSLIQGKTDERSH